MEDMKALPTCDLSLKILCKLFNVLEVCFGLCVQKREGVFREEASRVGLGKRCGKLCFIQRAILEKMFFFFPHWLGIPFKSKVIQHAQADHPLSLAQLLLG